MSEFLQRLKQRKLVQWAVAYVAAAFALLQGVDIVAQRFSWPDSIERSLIIASCIGFFLVLVLAWYHGERGAQRVTGTELLILALLLSLGGGFLWRFAAVGHESAPLTAYPTPAGPTAVIPEKSIAVLPFENLSSDKDNAYFAEGIQDEILTRLSKIAALKVISRTSTQKYKSAPENLREIGKQLGVANLLEGSVQKIANAVHVNVQLIRVSSDEHLWAESYNRKLDDVFAVEGEVAGTIAEQLNAKLSGIEKQDVATKPTNNPEAYDAYLRGVAFADRPDALAADFKSAAQSFATAVRLDPNFALAWARLSYVHASIFFNFDQSAARQQAAHAALQKALELQPDLLETRLANAYFHYFIERDYDGARQIFQQVREQSPNNSEAPLALALIARRQGRWEESLAHFQEALALDPRNVRILNWNAVTEMALRHFPTALKLFDRALEVAPADNEAFVYEAAIFQALDQLDKAEAVIAKMHADAQDISPIGAASRQFLLRRNYPAGIALLRSSLTKLEPSDPGDPAGCLFFLGRFQELVGDAPGAGASYQKSRDLTVPLAAQQPDNADFQLALALADVGLGHKEAALQEADRAAALLPAAKDALLGPQYEELQAIVLTRFGERDRALAALQHLLVTPYLGWYIAPITPPFLRLDPFWDNLRKDPRFQKLIADGEAALARDQVKP